MIFICALNILPLHYIDSIFLAIDWYVLCAPISPHLSYTSNNKSKEFIFPDRRKDLIKERLTLVRKFILTTVPSLNGTESHQQLQKLE